LITEFCCPHPALAYYCYILLLLLVATYRSLVLQHDAACTIHITTPAAELLGTLTAGWVWMSICTQQH
jgi:hypothetical protein